ncbi:phage tail terminator-like protein [Endozoicomonas sp. GU-1]|uniref:phage tail terminator-like protein n=1 Tax=Endozoicomonas sp. GU-1 TaxID=3009078 RepID=UPI0022B5DBAF|nr:phage tail terminator-like protein [Endozoicomonas sp. GU-1]WBA79554.1 phage tail terminator-like protein [Endozoicomonas sp. GU-1]
MLSPVISALNQHLTGLDIGLPIAWENITPPDVSGSWLAVFFVPADTVGSTLGDTGLDQTTGFFQIDINAPIGGGWAELCKHSDYIQRSFRIGKQLIYDGHSVYITSSSRTGARVESGWYRQTVTINWLSYNRRDGLPGEFYQPAVTIDDTANSLLPDIFN